MLMPSVILRLSGLLFSVCLACSACHAQDLTPRAYVITPVSWNAVILTYSFYDGNVLFPGAAPITGATARVNIPILSYYHALNFFGRSANITVSLPYGVGNYQGTVIGAERQAYRSGLLDADVRFSVNLKGGPAMSAKEFGSWRQKTLIGASLTVVAPTGQYYATRLINEGSNRWAFKPELGLSQRWVCRRVVLHYQPRVLPAQRVLSRHQNSNTKTHGRHRSAPEL
jgi:Putative MetA-pathway of phenol degradation